MVVPVFLLFVSPLRHLSRRHEFQADAYACAQARAAIDLAAALLAARGQRPTLTPDPVYVRLLPHPPASERLAAMASLREPPP